MKAVSNFKSTNDVARIQQSLFEVILRDAVSNPELYKETEILNDMTALTHFIGKINEWQEEPNYKLAE